MTRDQYNKLYNMRELIDKYNGCTPDKPEKGLGKNVVEEMLKGWKVPAAPPPTAAPKAPQDLDF
jgi:hypothetical protein